MAQSFGLGVIMDTCHDPISLAAKIDHTVLSPDATERDILKACQLAKKYGFRGLFTNPYWSALVAEQMENTSTKVGVSAAFPLGALPSHMKSQEVHSALQYIRHAAPNASISVDVVAHTGLLKQKDFKKYTQDLAGVFAVTQDFNAEYKVIIESALLSHEEIRVASLCAAEAGAHFVKTSTGRNGPPQLQDIGIMRNALPAHVGIKFSGFGTHNGSELARMALALGADILGSPQGHVLVENLCSA